MKYVSYKRYILPAAVIFFAAALLIRPELIHSLHEKLFSPLIPIFTGIILAAVLNPAVSFFERLIRRLCRRKRTCSDKTVRYISIALVYLAIAAVITAAVWIIIPRLIDSAVLFINSFDGYYRALRQSYDYTADRDVLGLVGKLDSLMQMLSDKLPLMLEKTAAAAASAVKSTADFIVGAVLAVYILAGREQITDFISSAAQASMSAAAYRRTAKVIVTVNECLVNFISGQLTEAVVLGTLCFAGMVILDFEYPLLISTIIAVTALIPVVGAFAGAIPSALVLFLAKPSSALWFIVFIIILQQLENNLIYPKIVGKSVGLPPILILVAIIIGAQVGGAAGIMLGIPLVSAVYILIRNKISELKVENR